MSLFGAGAGGGTGGGFGGFGANNNNQPGNNPSVFGGGGGFGQPANTGMSFLSLFFFSVSRRLVPRGMDPFATR